MCSKYASLKFAMLVTPYFVTVPLAIYLMNILNVSIHEIGTLTILGLIFGLYYLIVGYVGSTRKFKFIAPLLIVSIPLVFALQFIIQMALEYDSVMIIIWAFVSGSILPCTFEILRIIKLKEYAETIE